MERLSREARLVAGGVGAGLWAKTPPTPLDRESYGRVLPRHSETVNLSCHVKAMKIDALRDPNLWRARKITP